MSLHNSRINIKQCPLDRQYRMLNGVEHSLSKSLGGEKAIWAAVYRFDHNGIKVRHQAAIATPRESGRTASLAALL